MPAFHLLRCAVAIGGDAGNQVCRDRTRPIVFPELPILQFIHGEEAITDVHVVGQWNTTNDEVLERLRVLYDPEVLKEVFPGARPRLPMADATIPLCTQPVYKPRPVLPDNPDPRLRPLDQFTGTGTPVREAPPLEVETEPTPDEIAAHAQDDDDDPVPEEDLGLARPDPAALPHITRDMKGRGTVNRRTPNTLPDVAAGGSHSPTYEP